MAKNGVLLVCAIAIRGQDMLTYSTFRECEGCCRFVCSRASEQRVEALPRQGNVKVLQ